MIAFGVAITDPATFERVALPGIRRVAEPGARIFAKRGFDSIQQPYNEILEEAGELSGLEALVLLHQDLELTDDSLPRRARALLSDPRVGLIGALGARNLRLHCWTKAEEVYGIAMAPGLEARLSTGPVDVDGVDGALLVIAPWVVRTLRFNEELREHFHGYDVDFSLRVGAAGGRVVCDDIPYFHHMAPRTDHDAVRSAGVALAQMWDSDLRPRAWAPAFQ